MIHIHFDQKSLASRSRSVFLDHSFLYYRTYSFGSVQPPGNDINRPSHGKRLVEEIMMPIDFEIHPRFSESMANGGINPVKPRVGELWAISSPSHVW